VVVVVVVVVALVLLLPAEYTVVVVHEREHWSLRKRFNEFAVLHDVLSKRLPAMPQLPAKSVVRQFNAEYLEARKKELTLYLRELCKRRDVLNSQEAQQFLGLPQHVAAFRQTSVTEPIQAAEVHEAAFGIADFVYDPMQGLLLLGATDFSLTSRLDTKITNIKLPWEPAAPNLPTAQMSLWRQTPSFARRDLKRQRSNHRGSNR